MSHFLIGVILPQDVDNEKVEAYVEHLLAPFNEELEVDEYEEKCYCIGKMARKESILASDKKFGTWDELRAKFRKDNIKKISKKDGVLDTLYEAGDNLSEDKQAEMRKEYEKLDKELSKIWEKKYYNDRTKYTEEAFENSPNRNVVNLNCENCGGTGKYKTTYNKDSRWDWYRIGGRWDGYIKGIERESKDKGFNFSSKHQLVEFNVNTIENFLELYKMEKVEYLPFAIIDLDGEWIEKGQMGMWGMAFNEMDNWDDIAYEILSKYKTSRIVGIDCHI